AEFGIRHRGSTVPERSGVALSFCRRPVSGRAEMAASRSKCNSQLKNRSVLITKLNEIPPPKHRDRLASERTEPSRLSTIFFAKDPPKISSSVAETAAIHTPPGIA
ncbi:hypothetical protein CYD26_24805, partial [Pseudomonas sp. FFUP_PS_473]